MKVLHIVQSFDVSGRSRVIHDLALGLKASGIESEVACFSGSAGYRQEDLPCICLGRRRGRDPVLPLRLALLMIRGKVSLVHTHGKGALAYGSVAASLAGRPLLHTVHRADGDRVFRREWMRRVALSRVRSVIGVSDAARRCFVETNGFPESSTVTIYNGIDIARFERSVGDSGRGLDQGLHRQGSGQRSRRGWEADKDRDNDLDEDLCCPNPQPPTIGTVANLNDDKDIETLLRAFTGIRAAVPGVRLLIAGDGHRRGELRRFAEAEGLGEHVDFLGFTPDVPGLLRSLDIFVLSTRTEGLGIAILEAMASGVPVVASAVGGIMEIVADGDTGMLFPGADHERLRDVVVGLLGDGELGRRLVRNARADVAQRFSNERMCEQYGQVYKELVR
ncbi:MAG: glycosyltransferase [Lentisphaerae bacterium]|nr:glycosyltransferase [Lentisphaerota bacterium]